MPLFMSVHERVPDGATAEDIAATHDPDREIRRRHGVRSLRYWVGEAAGKIFCLVEAPSAEHAAAAHRDADGLLADRIYEVIEGRVGDPRWTAPRDEGSVIMAQPLIFIFRTTIKDGKLGDYEKFLNELTEFLVENEPRLIAQEVYVDDDGTESVGILIHPDAESMEFHLQLLAEWSYEEFLETTHIEVCGELSPSLRTMFEGYAAAGVPVTVRSYLGGINRLPA